MTDLEAHVNAEGRDKLVKQVREKINELDLNQDEKEWFDKGVNSVKNALAGIDI